MAQATTILNCAVSGTVYTTNLNAGLAAINSMNSGASAPASTLVDGKLWLDTSSATYKMKLYRTVWHPLFEFTTSEVKLTVNNAAVVADLTVGGTINNTSDRRVKTKLEVIMDAEDKVNTLTGYTYDRTDMETSRQAGLIAQQVEAVLPEAVTTAEDGTKSLNYNSVIALLVEVAKEQSCKIAQLEERLGRLENV